MNDKPRRIIGLALGLALGLAFGLISGYINLIFLPGIPLYHPGPDQLTSILLNVLGGGLLGLLAAWPEDAIPGVLLSALIGALATTLTNLIGRSSGLEMATSLFVLLLMTFLPRVLLFIPVAALIRWGLHVWAEEFRSVSFSIPKLALTPAVLLIAAVVSGALSLYAPEARQALKMTNDLVQKGLQASSSDELPRPIQSVDGFLQGARGAYTLELSDNPDLLPVQRPFADYGVQEYAVFIRFENGYRFGCVFTPPNPNPSCGIY